MTAGLKFLRPAVPYGSVGCCHFHEDPRRARAPQCRFGAGGVTMFRPIAQLEDLLVHRGPFIYSPQRGTVGGITDLADGDPDADDIELLEVQDWSGNPVGSGVGFRQESGTLNTGIALTFPVIL